MAMKYTEEQLNSMSANELRKIVTEIEQRVNEKLFKVYKRDMMIDAILEDQEEKGGS